MGRGRCLPRSRKRPSLISGSVAEERLCTAAGASALPLLRCSLLLSLPPGRYSTLQLRHSGVHRSPRDSMRRKMLDNDANCLQQRHCVREELVWHLFYLVLLAGAAIFKQPEHRGGNCDEQSGTAPSQLPLQSNRSRRPSCHSRCCTSARS